MKRKQILSGILILSLNLFISINSSSQILISLLLGDKLNSGNIEFGLTGGLNRTYLPDLGQSKGANFFNLGFYFDIKLKDKLFAHTGVLVKSNMGAQGLAVYSLGNPNLDTLFINGEVRRKINYFNVPLEIKYRIRNHFFVDAGGMVSLKYKAEDEFFKEIKEEDDLSYKLDISDQISTIDFGLIVGLGYKLKKEGPGMSFGAKYYYGLTDVFKDERNSRNTSLYFYAHIPIGAGKGKK